MSACEQTLGYPLSCPKTVESGAGWVSKSSALGVDGAAASAVQMRAWGFGGFVLTKSLNSQKSGHNTT